MISLEDIKNAAARLKGVATVTPLIYSYFLSDFTGANVYLKLENLQRTGSFKMRGSYNKLFQFEGANQKFITASAGNHAQGVALAAKLLGLKATVVMPETASLVKILAVQNYGAEVILKGNVLSESLVYAKELGKKSGALMIHPYDDEQVVAGQGTIGLEIFEDLKDFDGIFIPVGGGGLVSGIAAALRESGREKTKIIGAQVANKFRTIADGIAVKDIGKITGALVKKYNVELMSVADEEIIQALLFMLEKEKVLAEGAGAASLAGFLARKKEFKNRNVVIVVSGGNIDSLFLEKLISEGLVLNGRIMNLEVELIDAPGALAEFATLLSQEKVNIIEIHHNRERKNLSFGRTKAEALLEVMGDLHQKRIFQLLKKRNYNPKIMQ